MKSALQTAGLALTLGWLGLRPAPANAATPEPRAQAAALILRLDAPATRERVTAPLAKAKDAQTRAQNARNAGDLKHASELDTLALLWAEVAEDMLAAVAAEQHLADVQKSASELERKALDTQALVEQAIARRARAAQSLTESDAKSKSAPTTSSEPSTASRPAHGQPGAKKEPKKPAKPAAGGQVPRE